MWIASPKADNIHYHLAMSAQIIQSQNRCSPPLFEGGMRKRLPDRRASETFDVEAGGLCFTATVSWFEDGRLGEVFINSARLGSTADTAARDAAIAASIAVQYGADAGTIRHALCRDSQGRPSGPLAAVLDAIDPNP
jgi:ribonucleoside-diphosphate reductase alpha chain